MTDVQRNDCKSLYLCQIPSRFLFPLVCQIPSFFSSPFFPALIFSFPYFPQGFDLELVGAVSSAVTIPVIASSGAGVPEHFSQVFAATKASAALAAGIFHRREVPIEAVKKHMAGSGVPTRL